MTRMSDDCERQREEIENALAVIARARVLLRTQVILRLKQAVQRGHGDLLSPALECIELIDHALEIAQASIAAEWRAGEKCGWQ